MPVERRERVIAIWLGSTGNGRNPMFNGRRQPSRGGTSRMTRECQVRFCERFPRAYSAFASKAAEAVRPCTSATPPKADVNSPPWLPPLSARSRREQVRQKQERFTRLRRARVRAAPHPASLECLVRNGKQNRCNSEAK